MRFDPKSAKPVEPEIAAKGTEFARSMLQSGHDYHSVNANFLRLFALEAVDQAGKRIRKGASVPMFEKSGRVHGSISEAARSIKVSATRLREILQAEISE